MLNWLDKLSTHFNQPQEEEQVKIFLHALRNNTIYQIDTAMERCLNELQFVPKLAEVHQRMPEQRYAPENPAAFVKNGPDTLDLIRPFAREICPGYDKLDSVRDSKQIHDIFALATKAYHKSLLESFSR